MKATALPTRSQAPIERRDVVLHIGSGKTGTSSVQYFLANNRPRLAAAGMLYPRSPGPRRHVRLGLYVRPDADLHNQLAWHRMGGGSPDQFRIRFERRLLAELAESDVPRVLMSDEALYGASEAALRRLRGLTDWIAKRVRLVVYLRRQDDHLVSRYQQVVKTGEVRRLVDRIEGMNFSSTYDYRMRLRSWERLLEPTEFVVRPFERERFAEGSLYQDFLDSVGVDLRADALEPVPSLNESLDAESVEFLRILNVYRVENEGAEAGLINNREIVVRLAESATGPTLTLPEHVLDNFMARWEESNHAVARDFLGDSTGVLFRSPRKSRNTTADQHLPPERLDRYLLLAGIPEAMHAPLRRLVEREAASHHSTGRTARPRTP